MHKLFITCLPFLLACNMATSSKAEEKKNEKDTVAIINHQNATTTKDDAPQLQAIKWSGIKEMTDETFKSQVLASSSITLVDFNADWCGPCKMLKPVLEKLVKEYDGKLNFVSVNVDKCPETANAYNVSSIPYLVFIQNAKTGNATIGLQPYENLKQLIDKELDAE